MATQFPFTILQGSSLYWAHRYLHGFSSFEVNLQSATKVAREYREVYKLKGLTITGTGSNASKIVRRLAPPVLTHTYKLSLTHCMYQQQHRPEDNNNEFWRKFVADYFAHNGRKEWCVSLYGNRRHTTRAFPKTALLVTQVLNDYGHCTMTRIRKRKRWL
ncbi:SEUSS transcriptional co-regulator [Artemisia annua]|uniref:SEUSS transcriptional co-regulator n=1 Tax=Artemisia annua TaxID=35608 RepID=A0A2U1M848_ARTAN|nr:SEUSS transcriptional co-regulator [Artemisia annua]